MRRLLLLMSISAAACHPEPAGPVDGHPDSILDASDGVTRADVLSVPTTVNRDVDVLVMVDDSPSTTDKQDKLKASFPTFVSTIDALPGGRPNLHLGVITSDVGTKGEADAVPGMTIGAGPGACSGTGKSGNLQGSTLVTGQFISDIGLADNTREQNYTDTLSNVFSSIASVGSAGCGFEQPLQAIRLALTDNPMNAGFLRPDANLVVLLLSDEDDCSMAHSTLLASDPTMLGPLQSFRCTRFGITCDQGGTTSDEMNAVGAKSGCHSNETSAYLTRVADYTSFLKGLKADQRSVMVAALVGDPTPVATELRTPPGGSTGIPALVHSCSYTSGQNLEEVADPAVRIAELATQFQHHVVQSVCGDLALGLADVGRQLGSLEGSTCLTKAIAQPTDCTIVDQHADGSTTTIGACPRAGQDCYTIPADAPACPDLQHLKLDVTRVHMPASDTVTTVSCVLP